MNLSHPWALIRSPIDMEVLLVLLGTTRSLTGREVARLVQVGSQPAVNAALRRLAGEGVVRSEEAGNAYLYALNREHLGAPAIELLAGIRTELECRLRAEIAGWKVALGRRSRGVDHCEAAALLRQIVPAGDLAAKPCSTCST